MTQTSTTFTNTDHTAANAFADQVLKGKIATVDGRAVHSQFGSLAKVWMNGTVSVQVRQLGNKHRSTDLFVKIGQTVTVG